LKLKAVFNITFGTMKNNLKSILFLAFLMMMFQFIISCSTVQKTSMACPDLPDARFNTDARHFSRNKASLKYTSARNHDLRKQSRKVDLRVSVKNNLKEKTQKVEDGSLRNISENNTPFSINYERSDYINSLTASADNNKLAVAGNRQVNIAEPVTGRRDLKHNAQVYYQVQCDTIISAMGDVILGKVTEVNQTEIKYKRCGDNDGPLYTIRRANISAIRYANGTRDNFLGNAPVDSRFSEPERKIEGLGLAGFIAGIAGLFVLGIPFGLVAFIFGMISLTRIKKSPSKYIGRGYAITSIVLGIIDVLGVIILISISM
jgi:hypothetical protein